MTNSFDIALLQLDAQPGEKVENLARAKRWLAKVPEGVRIACLPEFFNTGYHLDLIGDRFYTLAEPIPGATTEALAEIARARDMVIVANIPEADAQQAGVLYDTTFVLDAQGELVGRYRKTHLYPTEHRHFRAGDALPVFDLGFVRLGTATCFDHAFPEIFSTLAVGGAQLIVIPSAVPVGYQYLLKLRTRARAQDNQLWVVAVNRVGTESDVTYCGGSKVVNPRGEVAAEAAHEEALIVATVDLDVILEERKQEPVLRSRRPGLYR